MVKLKNKIEFNKENTLTLKGIAILMMMFHHCFRIPTLFKDYKVSFFPFSQDFVVDISDFFKICVSIFAFITGYGLILSLKKLNDKYEWSKNDILKWCKKRVIKVLSGFWMIALLSYIICQIVDGRFYTVFFDGKQIIDGIFELIANFFGLSNYFGTPLFCSTWWYMSLAVLFIITLPLFAKLFKKFGYTFVLICVIIIPRIFGWEFKDNTFFAFLFPLLLGAIFAEQNLLVKFANFKLTKNIYLNKFLKFIIESFLVFLCINIYLQLPLKKFWEFSYGVIPVFLICYLYEFYLDIPYLKNILGFFGKHSMNIFLIHTFYRSYYLNSFIYSFRNFIKIIAVLFAISLATSIVLELFKKLIRYDKLIDKLQAKV